MRYQCVDRLEDLEFHDARLRANRLDSDRLEASVQYLNLHQDAAQNPFEQDMELGSASLTMEGFSVLCYEPARYGKMDADGVIRPVGPLVQYRGAEAWQKLRDVLRKELTILGLWREEDGSYYLEGQGELVYIEHFNLSFTFEKATIAWDDFVGKAWYVDFGKETEE